jgi:hypothetical protein
MGEIWMEMEEGTCGPQWRGWSNVLLVAVAGCGGDGPEGRVMVCDRFPILPDAASDFLEWNVKNKK